MSKNEDEIKKAIGQMDPIKSSVIQACDAGALPLLQILIQGGGDVNTANKEGFTILMTACEKGYIDIVKYLIESQVDVRSQDINGVTAMDIAKKANQDDIIKILEELEENN